VPEGNIRLPLFAVLVMLAVSFHQLSYIQGKVQAWDAGRSTSKTSPIIQARWLRDIFLLQYADPSENNVLLTVNQHRHINVLNSHWTRILDSNSADHNTVYAFSCTVDIVLIAKNTYAKLLSVNYIWDARASYVNKTEFTITPQVPASPYLFSFLSCRFFKRGIVFDRLCVPSLLPIYKTGSKPVYGFFISLTVTVVLRVYGKGNLCCNTNIRFVWYR
jgi:hypothetical protein